MMENMGFYEKLRHVPDNAKRTIGAGRLKGFTDINPMWRLKALTETFGPCGFGWKYTIDKQWLEPGPGGEMAAFVNISLYVACDGVWSDPIPGTGGSSFIANERSGLRTSDECYKMALTDAISVACKALGVGADVYWDADRTKYSRTSEEPQTAQNTIECDDCHKAIIPVKKKDGAIWKAADMVAYSKRMFGRGLCADCMKKAKAAMEQTNAG